MKKLIAVILGFAFLLLSAPFSFAASVTPQIVVSDVASGIVGVQYSHDSDHKIKVMIAKGDAKYYYNLSAAEEQENYPLQLGSGIYQVSVLENITDNRYKSVLSQTVQVNLTDSTKAFLQSVQGIEWNASMKAIQKAQDLTQGMQNDSAKVKVIYEYIVDNFSYDHAKIDKLTSDYLPDVETIFAAKKGICYDYASLTAAMLRSVGVPAKLVKGYTDNAVGYHAWNEVYLNQQWVVIDTTYDSQMKALDKTYSMTKDAKTYEKKYEY